MHPRSCTPRLRPDIERHEFFLLPELAAASPQIKAAHQLSLDVLVLVIEALLVEDGDVDCAHLGEAAAVALVDAGAAGFEVGGVGGGGVDEVLIPCDVRDGVESGDVEGGGFGGGIIGVARWIAHGFFVDVPLVVGGYGVVPFAWEISPCCVASFWVFEAWLVGENGGTVELFS